MRRVLRQAPRARILLLSKYVCRRALHPLPQGSHSTAANHLVGSHYQHQIREIFLRAHAHKSFHFLQPPPHMVGLLNRHPHRSLRRRPCSHYILHRRSYLCYILRNCSRLCDTLFKRLHPLRKRHRSPRLLFILCKRPHLLSAPYMRCRPYTLRGLHPRRSLSRWLRHLQTLGKCHCNL